MENNTTTRRIEELASTIRVVGVEDMIDPADLPGRIAQLEERIERFSKRTLATIAKLEKRLANVELWIHEATDTIDQHKEIIDHHAVKVAGIQFRGESLADRADDDLDPGCKRHPDCALGFSHGGDCKIVVAPDPRD